MNAQAVKLELIKQITEIKNEQVLEQLSAVLKRANKEGGRKKAPALSAHESELLIKINEGLPEDVLYRFSALSEKLAHETLTNSEHEELLQLIPMVEAKAAERLQYLIRLAEVWNTSVDEVMAKLGIHTPMVIHG